MAKTRLKYPPPEYEQEFELLCLALLKEYWECPTLELYARRGQKQFGVDIFDPSGTTPLRAAQCKLHEPWKSLSPAEIRKEVDQAKLFQPKIDMYTIATTAKVSREAQNAVREINREHKKLGLFTVELLSWDKIKRLLDRYTNVASEFYALRDPEPSPTLLREIKNVVQASTAPLIAEQAGEAIHAELDQAKQFIEQHEYQIARLLLNRVRERSWDKFNPRQKFRLLSNLAATYLAEGESEKAASLFMEAKSYQPDDPVASANETVAWLLMEQPQRAFELADQYRKTYPNSARILAVWIQNAQAMPVEALESEVPAHLKSDPEILMALSLRATRENKYQNAEAWALAATKARAEWSQPWLLLAQIVLRAELPQEFGNYRELADRISRERLCFAEDSCNKAISFAKSEKNKAAEAEALMTRALLRDLLGRDNDAWDDARKAYEEDSGNPRVVRQYAMIAEERGRRDLAVDLLRKLVNIEKANENDYLLASALRARGGPGDAEEAIQIFRRIASDALPQAAGLRENVIQQVIDLLSKEKRSAEIENFLQQVPEASVSEAAAATFKGIASRSQGDQESAIRWGKFAISKLTPSSSRSDRRRLASLLSSCGSHVEALPLWQGLADPTMLSEATQRVIECALSLGKHDIVLRICRTLREARVHDDSLLELELSLFDKYDVEAAVKLLQDHMASHPRDKVRRLSLAVLGLRLNRKQLIPEDLNQLPASDETPPANWPALIAVMRESGHINEALICAYEMLRKHFSDVNAHRSYFLALSPMGPRPDVPEFPTVNPGAAVCYVEEGTAQERWLILEDSPDPDPIRFEVSPTSTIGQNLIGKKKGESFLLAPATVGPRTGTIKEILSKFVYRYQDCLNEWQVRFQEEPDVELVRVVKKDGTPGSEDLDISSIFRLIDLRAEQEKQTLEFYHSRLVPIHLIGAPFRRNSFESICYLASQLGESINCCSGSIDEYREAIQCLGTSSQVVIDLTALATLYLLQRTTLLKSMRNQPIVSQSTIGELVRLAAEEATPVSEGGGVRKVDTGYQIIQDTQPAKDRRAEELARFIESVTSSCKVVGCQELAAVEREKREMLVKAFGNYGAESIVLALNPGHVLWTDDFAMAKGARQEFGARSVWTQVVLAAQMETGILEPEIYLDATARLLGYGYTVTMWNVPVLLRAGSLASWNPVAWPLEQALLRFSDDYNPLPDVLRAAAAFMMLYCKEIVVPELRGSLTRKVLQHLAKRKEGLATARILLRALEQALPQHQTLDLDRLRGLVADIKSWLAERESGLPIL